MLLPAPPACPAVSMTRDDLPPNVTNGMPCAGSASLFSPPAAIVRLHACGRFAGGLRDQAMAMFASDRSLAGRGISASRCAELTGWLARSLAACASRLAGVILAAMGGCLADRGRRDAERHDFPRHRDGSIAERRDCVISGDRLATMRMRHAAGSPTADMVDIERGPHQAMAEPVSPTEAEWLLAATADRLASPTEETIPGTALPDAFVPDFTMLEPDSSGLATPHLKSCMKAQPEQRAGLPSDRKVSFSEAVEVISIEEVPLPIEEECEYVIIDMSMVADETAQTL